MADSDESEVMTLTFEEAMRLLEEIVSKLEKGDLTLEESIEIYTEGMKLASFCSEKINEAESRITMLTERNGETEETVFNAEI